MIGNSLFVGTNVELTEIDPDIDAEILSSWTVYPQFTRRVFREPFHLHPVFEIKKKFFEYLKDADEHRESIYFGLRRTGENRLLGIAWFSWIDGTNQVSAFRFFFDPAQNLEGFMDEAFQMFLRYGFMELSMHRLECWIGGDDPEGVALLERTGFLREVQRREAVFSEGRYFDEYIYAMMKPEWKLLSMEGAK